MLISIPAKRSSFWKDKLCFHRKLPAPPVIRHSYQINRLPNISSIIYQLPSLPVKSVFCLTSDADYASTRIFMEVSGINPSVAKQSCQTTV